MTPQSELHNQLAGKIVGDIVRPILATGGTYTDVMVLTESVLLGVALMCIKLGGDNIVPDTMFERAKSRLTEIRLTDIKPAGEA